MINLTLSSRQTPHSTKTWLNSSDFEWKAPLNEAHKRLDLNFPFHKAGCFSEHQITHQNMGQLFDQSVFSEWNLTAQLQPSKLTPFHSKILNHAGHPWIAKLHKVRKSLLILGHLGEGNCRKHLLKSTKFEHSCLLQVYHYLSSHWWQ